MSEISRDTNTLAESNMVPDLFQYYIRGVTELLAGDDLSPSSRLTGAEGNGSIKNEAVVKEGSASGEKNRPAGLGSLFSNAVGDGLSGIEKERLMAMLRQSVVALTREVDEMLGPVFSMQRLRGHLAISARYPDTNSEVDVEKRAQKRLKGSPNKPPIKCQNKGCAKFSNMDKNTKSNPGESKSLCGDCIKQSKGSHNNMNDSFLGSSSRDDKGNGEVNDDLQVLVNGGPKVLEKMDKHAAEISATLVRMEEKVEELLDVIISSCRPMTLPEKHRLRILIEKLPPRNVDRVAEILQRGKPSEKQNSHDINVELQREDDLTLWRIYFYVKAVESAQKLV